VTAWALVRQEIVVSGGRPESMGGLLAGALFIIPFIIAYTA
jgi:hypothetical protein